MPVYRAARGERTLSLLHPFSIKDAVVEQITVRPPTLGQAREWGPDTENLPVLAAMTGQPIEVLQALRWPDAEAVIAVAYQLLPDFIRDALTSTTPETLPDG